MLKLNLELSQIKLINDELLPKLLPKLLPFLKLTKQKHKRFFAFLDLKSIFYADY